MAAIAKKLISQQRNRAEEIQRIRVRILQKDVETLNREIVQSRLDAISRSWSEIRRTHFDLIARNDAESVAYVNSGSYAQMEDAFEAAYDEVITLRLRFDTPPPVDNVVIPATTVASPVGETLDLNPREAKLPKLDLPTFTGKHEDWENFCDLFTSLVHNVARLSDASKFQYLKTCLKDSAADLVKDIFVTNANYLSTWQTLKARYSNPGLTVNNYLTTLLDLPYLEKESANELRSLIDKAQSIVRALANLKLPVQSWDIWFVHILVKRLDPESRKLWEAEVSVKVRKTAVQAATNAGSEPEILEYFKPYKEFIEFIEQRIQALTMIATDATTSKASSAGDKKPASSPGKRGATHVGVAQADGRDSKSTKKCSLCSRQHNLWSCPKFLAKNPYDRRDAARRLRLCFLCLVPHDYKTCSSKRTCSKCQRKHNTLLHTEQPPNRRSANVRPNTTEVAENPDKTNPAQSQLSSDVRVLTASCLLPSRRVLLATAQILVVAPDGTECLVNALLDQGSEASFISENIVQSLRIARKRTQVSLTGIGATSLGSPKFMSHVTLCSRHNPEATFNTAAYILPKLTNQLPPKRVVTIHNNELVRLKLADPGFLEPKRIDLILGAEVYAQILKPGLLRINHSELIAQETAFGWIVSGSLKNESPRRAAQSSQVLRSYNVAVLGTQPSELENELQRFWMVEEVSPLKMRLDPLKEACERLFIKRTQEVQTAGIRYISH